MEQRHAAHQSHQRGPAARHAYYLKTPQRPGFGLNSTFFLYEVLSKRRTILGPSILTNVRRMVRDGLQIFYSKGAPGKVPLSTWSIFWDATKSSPLQLRPFFVIGK